MDAVMQRTVEEESTRSVYRLGAVLSIVIAVGYVAIGVLMGLDPVERQRGHAFYEQLVRTPGIAMTWRPIFVVIGFLTIGVINALTRLVKPADGKWAGILGWFTIMAYVGSVTQAIDWMREYKGIGQYIEVLASGDPHALRALEIVTAWWVDPEFLWRFGALGLWYGLVSILGARNRTLPRGATAMGVLAGACLVLAMVFGMTDTLMRVGGVQIAAMQIPSALGGAIFGPIFHVWAGLVLWRRSAAGGQAAAAQALAA